MRSVFKLTLISASLLILLIVGWRSGFSQTEDQQYFPETGHFVQGEFLDFYLRIKNADQIFGYPLTEQFNDPDTGRLVQYFQRVRFELYPDNATAGSRVQLSPLGTLLYEPGEPVQIEAAAGTCRTFLQTGFEVCSSFLRFFDQHGGESQFGLPISGVELHNGRRVQNFTNARFEWHPERRLAGQEVRLSELGSIYFYAVDEDPIRLRSVNVPAIQDITSIVVRAFPVQAVVFQDDPQAIFVVVQDQTLNPVVGARITILARLPSGRVETFNLGQTNEFGFTSGSMPFRPDQRDVGLIELQVIADYKATFREKTVTSYRISP